MTDRICIATGGNVTAPLSAIDMVSCCTTCSRNGLGCSGGAPSKAWQYYVAHGVVSAACQPYPFAKCAHDGQKGESYPACHSKPRPPTPQCYNATCAPNATAGATPARSFGNTSYTLNGTAAYQRELMLNGPIQAVFAIYSDFQFYKSGVYTRGWPTWLYGHHAVKIVGWGSERGTDYWEVANSYNAEWGMGGFFRIKRGVNECGIEGTGVAGTPALA
jgi:hypothetical protein